MQHDAVARGKLYQSHPACPLAVVNRAAANGTLPLVLLHLRCRGRWSRLIAHVHTRHRLHTWNASAGPATTRSNRECRRQERASHQQCCPLHPYLRHLTNGTTFSAQLSIRPGQAASDVPLCNIPASRPPAPLQHVRRRHGSEILTDPEALAPPAPVGASARAARPSRRG